MINKNISIICQCLTSAKIPHIVGGSSYIGLTTGELNKYTNNVTLYIFNYNPFKIIPLFFSLLKERILLKPKLKLGHLRFKLRKKNSLFSKNFEYYTLFPGKIENSSYKFFIGGRYIYFNTEDLNENNISKIEINNHTYSLPCNYKEFKAKYSANLYSEIYPYFSVSLDNKTEIQAVNLLEEVVSKLKECGCIYWLDGGTLLGAVRDKKLIPWDHDLDVGIKYESDDVLDKLILQLRKKYYIRALPFSSEKNIWRLGKYRIIKVYPRKNLFFYTKLCLDIFIFYREVLGTTNQLVYKYSVFNKNAYYDHNLLDELSNISFYGRNYSIPSKTNDYLEAKYGKNWKVPKEKWNVVTDDGSIIR